MTEQHPSRHVFRTSQLEEADGPGHNPTDNCAMGEIIAARFSRRGFLKGSLAATAISATISPFALLAADEARAQDAVEGSAFSFPEVEAGVDADHHVAQGYDADILLRWGDKVFADASEFDPLNQSEAAQERQFGYNNDFVGFIPLEGADDHGLLVVNHEYTNEHLMFPGIVTVEDGKIAVADATEDRVDIEMAAHGGTIIEIRKQDGKWQPVPDSALNRRITAKTPMQIRGPAAGHARMQTAADPSGTRVLGTINNCAAGVTPWGTYIMAEENIHGYFMASCPKTTARPGTTSAWASARTAMPGAGSTTASTSARNRTSPTASAGSSRSMSWTLPRPPGSAPRSAASSTRGRRAPWPRTAASSSIWATTSVSIMSTSS